jgi:hypothetical protein
MKTVTRYIAANGGEFNTPEEAMSREDQLPGCIATYEADLVKFVAGGKFGSEILTEETAAAYRRDWQNAIADYKTKWAEAQAQRKAQ